jgi:hypothetical protein
MGMRSYLGVVYRVEADTCEIERADSFYGPNRGFSEFESYPLSISITLV